MIEVGSVASGNKAVAEGQGALRYTPRANDYGTLGIYSKTMRNGASAMGAGLAGGSPIASLRYGGATAALIRRVTFHMAGTATAFTAGDAFFDLFVARAFTGSDSGGNTGAITGNQGKLRTNMATTGLADFRVASTGALTPGTRTLDTDPLRSLVVGVTTAVEAQFVPVGTELFRASPGEMPLVLANNEGLVLQATVPATGTWFFAFGVDWDEVPATW
jgi:hypothetical protein